MSSLFLTKDLLFSSSVTSAAADHGLEMSVISDQDTLVVRALSDHPRLILLDLTTPRLNIARLIPQLRESMTKEVAIVAFGPHVGTTSLMAARKAGCDEVLTRGYVHNHLDDLLEQYTHRFTQD